MAAAAAGAPAGPWMYTGGLENHLRLVARLARARTLWGNGPEALGLVRSPTWLARIVRAAGCPSPRLAYDPAQVDGCPRWLLKPVRGTGGAGVCFWAADHPTLPRGTYLQEYIEGRACSAAFCADDGGVRLLGATQQLIGEQWLHAGPFQYCGSVGPVELGAEVTERVRVLGRAVAQAAGLRGLFGIDFILRDGTPWPVELNPRYTASMEVLEHALGVSVLALHCRAFESEAAPDAPVAPRRAWVGKAVYFARSAVVFPEEGPWSVAPARADPWCLPDHSDVPRAGERIGAGEPVLTLFAAGRTQAECVEGLRRSSGELARCLGVR